LGGQVSSFRFQVSGFKFQVSGFRFQVSGVWVLGFGFLVWGSGLGVLVVILLFFVFIQLSDAKCLSNKALCKVLLKDNFL
jgi:hypothetical protein